MKYEVMQNSLIIDPYPFDTLQDYRILIEIVWENEEILMEILTQLANNNHELIQKADMFGLDIYHLHVELNAKVTVSCPKNIVIGAVKLKIF